MVIAKKKGMIERFFFQKRYQNRFDERIFEYDISKKMLKNNMTDGNSNNLISRLAAFIVSAMITVVVVLSTRNCGVGFEGRVQFFLVLVCCFWMFLLIRAKGWKKYSFFDLLFILAIVVGVASFICVTVWHSGYLTITPLIGINSAENGIGRDTLYHSAIAAGIENYGYSTLLVNSDAFHNYHFGSHMIMGLFAALFRIPTYFSYCYFYPIVFGPLYIYLLFSVPARIRRYLGKSDYKKRS